MATTKRRSSRKSSSTRVIKRASAVESLNRARTQSCPENEAFVVHHFVARGIPADQITPRENVLTFNAWRALGRTVRKGERGCKLGVWVPIKGKDKIAPPRNHDRANADDWRARR